MAVPGGEKCMNLEDDLPLEAATIANQNLVGRKLTLLYFWTICLGREARSIASILFRARRDYWPFLGFTGRTGLFIVRRGKSC
jgi:hypothetical protein